MTWLNWPFRIKPSKWIQLKQVVPLITSKYSSLVVSYCSGWGQGWTARTADHSKHSQYFPEETHLVAELGPSSRQQRRPAAGHGRMNLRAAEDKKHGTLMVTWVDIRTEQRTTGGHTTYLHLTSHVWIMTIQPIFSCRFLLALSIICTTAMNSTSGPSTRRFS